MFQVLHASSYKEGWLERCSFSNGYYEFNCIIVRSDELLVFPGSAIDGRALTSINVWTLVVYYFIKQNPSPKTRANKL